MKKIILIGTISIVSFLFAREPSVYGAGNIDSSSPYGLTKTEKGVLENRRTVQNLKNRVYEQQNRIEGLTTIIDGLNKEVLSLKEQLSSVMDNSKIQDDYNKTYSLLLELSKMVDQINDNYVTHEDLRESLAGSRVVQQQQNSVIVAPIESSNSVDISTIYRRGVQLFAQKSYNSAKENFEEALAKNYKLASTNYYLGEIAYYTQDYYNAIDYYKKSASLYDSANYMKTLYLHTAISLSRSGQEEQAKNFFQFIIDTYPNTRAAEIAQKNL